MSTTPDDATAGPRPEPADKVLSGGAAAPGDDGLARAQPQAADSTVRSAQPDPDDSADSADSAVPPASTGTTASPAAPDPDDSTASTPPPASGGAPDGTTPPAPQAGNDGRPAHHRRIVSYTARGGRLNAVQRKAYDAHADRWLVTPADLGSRLDPLALFGRPGPLVIEIGSGMGASTVAMAAAAPHLNLLAVEVYPPGVAQTLHGLAKAGVGNARILRADAVPVLMDLVAPDSVDEVWVFFPDPWPKARHHKRRMVTAEFAALVAGRLRPGGRLRLATDWEDYAEQMLQVCDAEPGLSNAHGGWAPRFAARPLTKFENRGHAEGNVIRDLEYLRV